MKQTNSKFVLNHLYELTLVIIKGEHYFVGTVKELPAVVSQGMFVSEAKKNTLDALNDYLEDMRQDNEASNSVLEEELIFQ